MEVFKMKKVKAILMAVLMLVSMMAVTVSAEDSTYNGFAYEMGDGYVMIYDYVGTESEITVPATIEDLPVVAVYTTSGNDTVTKVTLEEGILELGHAAFDGYSALETVVLPSTLEFMGQSAIIHAPNVESISVAEDNEYFVSVDGVLYEKMQRYQISEETGEPLWDEPMITLGYGLRAYPAGKADTSYTVLDTIGEYDVVEIAERAFSDAKTLKSVVVPESVNLIWYAAFEKCENLEKLVFYNMKHLEELPEGAGDEPTAIFGYYYDEATGIDKMAPAWVENITVYCYKGSDMDGYIESLAIDEINVSVKYLDDMLVADAEDVTIAEKAEGAIEDGTKMVVSNVAEDKLPANAKEKLGDVKFKVLDISLQKNGVTVQPKGEVVVSIRLPEGFDGTKCNVYHIAEDGTFTDMKATYADGYFTFVTDHFSNYAVVEGTVSNETAPKAPLTGDMANAGVVGIWMAVACGAMVILLNKKRYTK